MEVCYVTKNLQLKSLDSHKWINKGALRGKQVQSQLRVLLSQPHYLECLEKEALTSNQAVQWVFKILKLWKSKHAEEGNFVTSMP